MNNLLSDRLEVSHWNKCIQIDLNMDNLTQTACVLGTYSPLVVWKIRQQWQCKFNKGIPTNKVLLGVSPCVLKVRLWLDTALIVEHSCVSPAGLYWQPLPPLTTRILPFHFYHRHYSSPQHTLTLSLSGSAAGGMCFCCLSSHCSNG